MRASGSSTATLGALIVLASCQGTNPAYRARLQPDAEAEAFWASADAAEHKTDDALAPDLPPPIDLAPSEVPSDASAPDTSPSAQPTALLVVRNLDLEPMDQQSHQRLLALGFTVELKLDAEVFASDALGKAVVIVSGSTLSAWIGSAFRDVAVPVICFDSRMFPWMGLTGEDRDADFGYDFFFGPTDMRLEIFGGHPLAANLSGRVVVTDRPIDMSWARPFPEAVIVASLVGDPSRITLFGYPEGARLEIGPAPARRVGSFIRFPNGRRLTDDGLKLFDAAVLWATSREP